MNKSRTEDVEGAKAEMWGKNCAKNVKKRQSSVKGHSLCFTIIIVLYEQIYFPTEKYMKTHLVFFMKSVALCLPQNAVEKQSSWNIINIKHDIVWGIGACYKSILKFCKRKNNVKCWVVIKATKWSTLWYISPEFE